jgi:hypothetical protein
VNRRAEHPQREPLLGVLSMIEFEHRHAANNPARDRAS